jgi:tetratricopeptide (TPR) repeat protein
MGRQGDQKGALALLNGQSSRFEDNTKFLALRARFAREVGDDSSALADFGRLASLLPGDALVAVTHAGLLRDSGETKASEGELQRALDIEPRLVETRYELAAIALKRNDIAGAKKILGSPEDHLDSPRLLVLSAAVASKENRPDDALDLAGRAFELAPNNMNLIALAEVQRSAGRETEALAGLSSWVKEHPDDLLTLNYLADSLLEMGQIDGAVALYETSLARNPGQPAVINNLAWALRESDLDRAYELAQRAVALAPSNENLQETLADIEQLMSTRK